MFFSRLLMCVLIVIAVNFKLSHSSPIMDSFRSGAVYPPPFFQHDENGLLHNCVNSFFRSGCPPSFSSRRRIRSPQLPLQLPERSTFYDHNKYRNRDQYQYQFQNTGARKGPDRI